MEQKLVTYKTTPWHYHLAKIDSTSSVSVKVSAKPQKTKASRKKDPDATGKN